MSDGIRIECGPCGATGIYVDTTFEKPEGVGLLCRECRGKGYKDVTYAAGSVKLFTQRKVCHGIWMVWPSMSVWTANNDYSRYSISYQDFMGGQMPATPGRE